MQEIFTVENADRLLGVVDEKNKFVGEMVREVLGTDILTCQGNIDREVALLRELREQRNAAIRQICAEDPSLEKINRQILATDDPRQRGILSVIRILMLKEIPRVRAVLEQERSEETRLRIFDRIREKDLEL